MKKLFITSDIHSYFSILQNKLLSLDFDESNPNHYLLCCGDLFDRGPESLQLLKFVQTLGDRFLYVRGNHEDLLEQCVRDIVTGKEIDYHHIHNGTISTIVQLVNDPALKEFEQNCLFNVKESESSIIYKKMKPILEWINDKTVDCYKINDNIFVHGWIPYSRKVNSLNSKKWISIDPNWDKVPDSENIEDLMQYKSRWKGSRWVNGMEAWHEGIRLPNKTIWCGHWHVSSAHCKYHGVGSEFGKDACFEPFYDEGIVALDACTAYSGHINCITLEIEDEVPIECIR